MAIRAVNAPKLENVASKRPVHLLWVPAHANIVGNEIADQLARKAARIKAAGPAPFLPMEEKRYRASCTKWLQDQIPLKWNTMNTCNHTKKFLIRPEEKVTDALLKLDKTSMRIIIGIITGHCRLNAYLARLRIRADPDCDYCGHLEETAYHFLCDCPGYYQLRSRIFGTNAITAEEVLSKSLSKIIAFARQSGRFKPLTVTGNRNSLYNSSHRPLPLNGVNQEE